MTNAILKGKPYAGNPHVRFDERTAHRLAAVLAIALAFATGGASAVDRTWNGGTGGSEAAPLEIYNADNWNPSGLPTTGDKLYFVTTAPTVVTNNLANGATTQISGNWELKSGDWTFLGPAKFTACESDVNSSGDITVVKKGDWSFTHSVYLCRSGDTMTFTNYGDFELPTAHTGRRVQIGNGGDGPCVMENVSGDWNIATVMSIGDACKDTKCYWRSGDLQAAQTNIALYIGHSITEDGVVGVVKDAGEWTLQGGLEFRQGTGTFDHNGGTTTVASVKSTTLAGSSGAVSTLNLNGGTFKTKEIVRGNAVGTAVLVFNGGELAANAASENGLVAAGVSVSADALGGTINAGNLNVVIAPSIGGEGAMTFKGGGTVTLSGAPTYKGATTVEVGTTLIVPSAIAGDKLAFTIPEGIVDGVYEVVRISGGGVFASDVLEHASLPSGNFHFTLNSGKTGIYCHYGVVSGDGKVWVGSAGDGKLSTAENWLDNTAPSNGDILNFLRAGTPVLLDADLGEVVPATMLFGTKLITITNGTLTVNTLTNASMLAVASTGSLTVEGDIVVCDGMGTFLNSNEGTVTVSGNAVCKSGTTAKQYDVVTDNTNPMRVGGFVFHRDTSSRVYFRLESEKTGPGAWVVGANGFRYQSDRQDEESQWRYYAQNSPVTLYSSANWTLRNSGRNKTTKGDLNVSSNSRLTINTSDYDDPTSAHTVTLEGRIMAEGPVTVTGCGTLEIATTGSHESLPEDLKHTCISNGTTLAVADTATLQVNAGKAIKGNGTISLAAGTTLAVSNAVDGSVTLPSISAAAGSTVFLASVDSTTPAIVLTGSISGPEIGDYAMLKKGDGPFAAGEYAIFSAAGTAEAVAAAAQMYLEPERADGLTYRYFADGDVVKLEVSALSDLGNFIWTGLGDGVNFSDPLNWENGEIAPTNGARVFIHTAEASTLFCDIADFAPASIEFLADSAAVTVKASGEGSLTNLVKVLNYADDVHHLFDMPVFFADQVEAEITFSNSRYIKFKNLTAWDLKKSNGSIYFWGPGTYEFLREGVDWSTSSKGGMIYMPNGSKTTLILHNPVMHSDSHNIDVRTNSKLVIRGDYNIYAGNGGERRVVFKAYGNNNNSGVWVDGWIKVGEQTLLRPNSGLSGGRLCAYGIENNSETPAELSTDTDGFSLSWGIGEGGLAGTGTFKTAAKPVWLRPLADYAIARPFEVTSTLKFDTTSITNNKIGMTTTVSNVISGAGNVEIVGKGAVRFAQNATFTGGLTVSGTATLALDEGALPGAGDVAMAKGTTLVIPHGVGLEDSLVAFPGAYAVNGDAGKVKIRFDGYEPPEGEWVRVFTADSIDINGQQAAQVFDFGFLAASEVRDGKELWLNKGNYGYIWADGASAEGWHVADKWTLAGRAATWVEDSPAVFTNAGDKATLDANATASELIFQADATVLSEAGSKLTAPVVSVESGAMARIEAETAGALEKTGDGALVVAFSRTQQTTLTEGTLVMEGTVDGSKLTLGKLEHVPVTFDYAGKTLTTGGARTFANGVDVTLTNGTFLLTRVSDARLTVAADAVVSNAGWTCVGPNPAAFANTYLHVRGGRLENTANNLVVGDKSAEGSVSEILVSDGGSIRVANDIRMLTGTTTLTVGDGAVDVRDTYLCYSGESEEASVVLNAGGELATRTVAYGANATGSAMLLFNGGTLKAKTDKADFVANGSGTGLENLLVKIGAGGAVIDTAGFSVGLPGAVVSADEGEYEATGASGAAPAFGLSVASSTGSGVLTLGASGQPYTYTGDTAVEGNATLVLVGGTSLAGGIAVRDGAVLKLSGSGTTTAGGALALEAGSAIESGSALIVASATLPASGTVKLTLSTLPAAGKSVTVVTRRNGTFDASDAAKFALESADDCTVEVSADGRSIVVSKAGVFNAGDKYGVNDCGELTQFQADWLNSLDNYGPLSEGIKTITPEDLDKASLLNLDLLAAGSNGGVEITDIASGSDNDGEFILLDVTLSRTGAVAPEEEGGRTPISGTLKIYATATLEDLDTFADCGEKVTIPDAKFATGDTVQCTYRRTDDTKMFFRAVIVAE